MRGENNVGEEKTKILTCDLVMSFLNIPRPHTRKHVQELVGAIYQELQRTGEGPGQGTRNSRTVGCYAAIKRLSAHDRALSKLQC